jgi:uncharacterized protein YbcI
MAEAPETLDGARAPAAPAEELDRGSTAAAISNAIVALFRDYLGRGPTRARATISEDTVTVILRGGLTKAERRLIEDGERDAVESLRRKFQRTMRPDMIGAVEEIMGRKVIGFMSGNDVDAEMSSEVFVLEPTVG